MDEILRKTGEFHSREDDAPSGCRKDVLVKLLMDLENGVKKPEDLSESEIHLLVVQYGPVWREVLALEKHE